MYRNALLLAAGLVLAVIAPARIEAQGVDGLWKLTYLSDGGTTELTDLVIELKTVDGKIAGKVLAARRCATATSSISR